MSYATSSTPSHLTGSHLPGMMAALSPAPVEPTPSRGGRLPLAILVVVYPVVVYVGVTRWSARTVGLTMACILLPLAFMRVRAVPHAQLSGAVMPFMPTLAVVVLTTLTNDSLVLLALPVLVNLTLLWSFAGTLRNGRMPMIERFARIDHDQRFAGTDLTEGMVGYCRVVTRIWCGFFVTNGLVSGVLAVFAPMEWWAVYTCLIAYILVFAIFLGERLVRSKLFRNG